MCGRYTLSTKQTWTKTFRLPEPLDFLPRFNIAPSQMVLTILGGPQRASRYRWGLIPSWAKDTKVGYSMINARSETLSEKPTFRKLLASQRCLIPADGFYEWKLGPDGKTKQPMFIHRKDGELFAFAGLWETWHRGAPDEIQSCTIITTSANGLMKPIHDRMPVILTPDKFEAWLEKGDKSLLVPMKGEELEAYPVSKLVNSPKNDTPECAVAYIPDRL